MTVLRKIGIGVAVLAGLLVVAIGALYALFDEAAIKRQLVDQVAAKTGRSCRSTASWGCRYGRTWPCA